MTKLPQLNVGMTELRKLTRLELKNLRQVLVICQPFTHRLETPLVAIVPYHAYLELQDFILAAIRMADDGPDA